MDSTYKELRRRWHTILRPFEPNPFTAEVIWADLMRRYTEPWRTYHNLHHIARMIATTDQLAHLATDLTSIHLAIFFHDVIYTPGSRYNEENSVLYAESAMRQFGISAARRELVAHLILATKLSTPPTADINEHIVRDADLETLGVPYDLFSMYNNAITREAPAPGSSDNLRGRIQVMQGFQARSQIYFTPELAATHEAQARDNIRRELHSLEAALTAVTTTAPFPTAAQFTPAFAAQGI